MSLLQLSSFAVFRPVVLAGYILVLEFPSSGFIKKGNIMALRRLSLITRNCSSSSGALPPISASVNANLDNLRRRVGDEADFVPGHQHHQHGMAGAHSHGHHQHGHSHGGGGQRKKFLLNGSQTVHDQRPAGAPSLFGAKKIEKIAVDKRPYQ